MTTFILAAILIILATLAFLVWPLLFTRNTFSYARHAQNIHFAKERLAELKEQLENASISATDYEALRLEIETTLAQDIDLANAQQTDSAILPKRPNKAAITALCVFIPLSAAAFYTYLGTPEALDSSRIVSVDYQGQNSQPSPDEINTMVANLEQKLIQTPGDLEGWALLSRTYMALGKYGKAGHALRRILELGGESADVYATLADATALAANGDMRGEPTQYADQALTLNPNNRQALWLRGLSAVQSGDKDAAQKHWSQLLIILSDQPEQQAELKKIMADSLGQDSLPNELISNSSPTPSETQPVAAVGGDQSGLSVHISIAPEIAHKLSPEDPVFVFARALNGPPPPLAAKRLTVADLPAIVTLSDADAMMPQFKLSTFPEVTVIARVSKSGQPIAQSGDYESSALKTKSDNLEQLAIVVSKLVE